MDDHPSGGSWARRHGRDALLLILTWAAGNVDAIGYLALGCVFTANMTGNTVLLGLHLAQEQGAAGIGRRGRRPSRQDLSGGARRAGHPHAGARATR